MILNIKGKAKSLLHRALIINLKPLAVSVIKIEKREDWGRGYILSTVHIHFGGL